MFSGTVQYCAPEVFVSGTYHAGPATVWSLGVLLFRMVSGYLPFADDEEAMIGILDFKDGLTKGKIGRASCRERVASPAEISAACVSLDKT